MFDRFQIVLAHYIFCMDYHNGQGSKEYKRMCKITSYFSPGYKGLDLGNKENELALEIYNALCKKHGYKSFEENYYGME